ncbi:MAG: serine protease [Polyangiaceae bacterium]
MMSSADGAQRVRAALVQLDPKARLADIICEDAGVPLSLVDFSGAGELTWASILRVARNAGRWENLLGVVRDRWPNHAAWAGSGVSSTGSVARAASAGRILELVAERATDPLEAMVTDLEIQDAAAWIASYRATMSRVGLLQIDNAPAATCFLIAPDWVLTNWHAVYRVSPGLRALSVRFDHWRRDSDQVHEVAAARDWRIAHSPWSAADTHGGVPAPGASALDFAVVRLENEVGNEQVQGGRRGWITLPELTDLRAGQVVVILQHPEGRPLRMAVDAVSGLNEDGTRVRYRANTLKGSSGSPCFDHAWRLLAMHQGHDPIYAGYNQGIPGALIRACLVAQGLTLPSSEAKSQDKLEEKEG